MGNEPVEVSHHLISLQTQVLSVAVTILLIIISRLLRSLGSACDLDVLSETWMTEVRNVGGGHVERLDLPGCCDGASILWSLLHRWEVQTAAAVGFLLE